MHQESEMQKGRAFSVVRAGIVIQEDSSSILSRILGSSQSPVTPALMSSSGLHEHLHSQAHAYTKTHTHTDSKYF